MSRQFTISFRQPEPAVSPPPRGTARTLTGLGGNQQPEMARQAAGSERATSCRQHLLNELYLLNVKKEFTLEKKEFNSGSVAAIPASRKPQPAARMVRCLAPLHLRLLD